MAQPGVSVKSLVSSFETRVVGMAPGPPRKRGCVSSPCSPRGASPVRGAAGPPAHRGLGGPGQRPSPRRGVDKTLLSLLLYCHSGSGSLVGIDNKIEQAMDLVKSHLMFAVREEVEVLKEQIRDLAERNAALEQENGLLRAQWALHLSLLSLTMCLWGLPQLPGLVPAACPLFLCSFNSPWSLGVGVKGSELACPPVLPPFPHNA
uniref:TSC22 domain family protein 3 n=1 Tax=Pipistrellus kuhlii TaxID=59472 RepID=A0A7J7YZL1_PIPKU|nr:TSC22 domain family member 4 [Pipistrellus kuhlii]